MTEPRFARRARLVVVTHVCHYRRGEQLLAYGPYVSELQLWADAFTHVTIAAPVRDGTPPADAVAIRGTHVMLRAHAEAGGQGVLAKLALALHLPGMAVQLWRTTRGADLVHVRCPGNLGLLAVCLGPFLGHRAAKYAGQWSTYPGEPFSFRLQRLLLRTRWWGAPVQAYTADRGEPAHVVPSFASSMTAEDMSRALSAAAAREPAVGRPLRVLCVGRLSREKGVQHLIDAMAALRDARVSANLTVVGDGPMRATLVSQVERLGLGAIVAFTGALPFDAVLGHYARADCLALPSHSEGWPKVVAEAMAHGLLVIGPARGLVTTMVGEGRGLAIAPGDPSALARALMQVAASPVATLDAGRRAALWASRYTLAGVRAVIAAVIARALDDGPARPHHSVVSV